MADGTLAVHFDRSAVHNWCEISEDELPADQDEPVRFAELTTDIDGRLEVSPSPLDLMLFQSLHRSSKNFAQNSWTLTGETKTYRLAPAVQD
jgi:hypothetical protein